jgi:hypothetical protein
MERKFHPDGEEAAREANQWKTMFTSEIRLVGTQTMREAKFTTVEHVA